MSDQQEIHSLFNEEKDNENYQYTDAQWAFIPDYNNGSYQNQIQFDTVSAKDQFVDWHTGYLAVPLQVQSSTGTVPYTAGTATAPAVAPAIKASLLSLLYGIVITNGSGATLVSDNGIQFINNIRLVVENSLDWVNSEGAEIMFSKDTANSASVQALSAAPSTTNYGGNSTTFNSGLLNRSILIQNLATFSAGVFSFTAIIPLKLIHDFFMQLDFPIINMRFQINFLHSFGSNNQYPCGIAGTGTTAATDIPKFTIGGGIGACRLYYRKLTFTPEVAQKLALRMQKGWTKTVKFLCTDFYNILNNNSTVNISQVITPSTVRPLRVWTLLYPAGAITGQTLPSPLVATGQLTNVNLSINNINYYQNSLVLPHEFWEQLREQFPNMGSSSTLGSMINYNDFITLYRYHCFDISRLKDRLKNPNDSVSILLTASRAESAPAAMDYVFLVEREQSVKFHFTSSDVTVTVGPNA